MYEKYLECTILRKSNGTDSVTIGDIVEGTYIQSLINQATPEQIRYGFLAALIAGNENPVIFSLGAGAQFYPYLLLEIGDWVLSEGGNFEQVTTEWFYSRQSLSHGDIAPHWFAGGWPSVYGGGSCHSFCDTTAEGEDINCIRILVPELTIQEGMSNTGCQVICLPESGVHCGLQIRREAFSTWSGACPPTRGAETRITQTCWAEQSGCGNEVASDAVVDYHATDKVVTIRMSQWQTLMDTIGPIFDFCHPTHISLSEWNPGLEDASMVEQLAAVLADSLLTFQVNRIMEELNMTLDTLQSITSLLELATLPSVFQTTLAETYLRQGKIPPFAQLMERFDPTVYRMESGECAAEVYFQDVRLIDNCSGVDAVKAMVDIPGGTRMVEMVQTNVEYRLLPNGDTCTVYTYSHTSDPIRISPPGGGCGNEVVEVRYEAADHCWNQSTWFKYIKIIDDTPPTIVTDQEVNVPLISHTTWVPAGTFDEGSWDTDCQENGLELMLARRSDWQTCITVCDRLGPGVNEEGLYDSWVNILHDLGIPKHVAHAAAAGEYVYFNQNDLIIDGISNFLNQGELEEDYYHQIKWLWEDESNCGKKVVDAWIFSLAQSIAEQCGATDEHGESLNIRDLENIFDNLYGIPGYGKEVALLGGGWAKAVLFKCMDACELVTAELLVMDYCCNWNIGWSDVKVEEKTSTRLVRSLPDLEISCEAYGVFYQQIVNAAAELGERGSQYDSTGVFTALDAAFGRYIPWNLNENGVNNGTLPDSLDEFTFSTITCTEATKYDSLVLETHLGTEWVVEPGKITLLDTIVKTALNGVVHIMCDTLIDQDIWVSVNQCGVGKLIRRFYLGGGCSGQESLVMEQEIRIATACETRASMFDLPKDVGSMVAPICLAGPITDHEMPESIGHMEVKEPLRNTLCQSIAIGHTVRELDVLGAVNLKKYEITWTALDWCGSFTDRISHQQVVIAVINPACESSTNRPVDNASDKTYRPYTEVVSGKEFILHQNYPNPFAGHTTKGFELPQAASAKLTIYDVTGRLLKKVEGHFDPSYHEVFIGPEELPKRGILFYRLESVDYSATSRMIR